MTLHLDALCSVIAGSQCPNQWIDGIAGVMVGIVFDVSVEVTLSRTFSIKN